MAIDSFDPADLFRDEPSDADPVARIPRDAEGRARVAAFTEPARSSAALEQQERAEPESGEEIMPEFVDENGLVEPDPMSETEKRELKQHFTPEEWAEVQEAFR